MKLFEVVEPFYLFIVIFSVTPVAGTTNEPYDTYEECMVEVEKLVRDVVIQLRAQGLSLAVKGTCHTREELDKFK